MTPVFRHPPRLPVTAVLAALALLAGGSAPAPDAAQAAVREPGQAVSGAAGLGDRYFPLAGNGGYDALHYDLTLGYVPATGRLTAHARVAAVATQNLRSFDLDLSGLTVRGVTVNGLPAGFSRTGQELVVRPRRPLVSGRPFVVSVDYDGRPGPLRGPDGVEGWIPTDDGAFVAGEPQGAMTWFPCNNHPRDKAGYDFTITVPDGYTAVANGTLAGRASAGGRTTFRWHSPEPMASYLATATIGRFQVQQYRLPSGLPVYNAVDPRESGAAAPVLARMPQIVDWESRLLGPYPFAALGAVVDHVPDLGYALETQTRPLYYQAPDEDTLVHELAHQWLGDSRSLTHWQDIWLNEGFATYVTWLYSEQHGGPTAQQIFDGWFEEGAVGDLWDFPAAAPPGPDDLFGQPVYTRGAMVLHKIRQAVGDEVFPRLLRAWASRRYAAATTAQFIDLAQRLSGKDLGPLLKVWLFSAGRPARQ
jgi:aminopeptidase N